MAEEFLKLHQVGKVYGRGASAVTVLDDVSLTVSQGEILGLAGPSGSGKTTLLQLAGLLDAPTRGEVIINGLSSKDMHERLKDQKRGEFIGFVFQFHHLLPEFTAFENVYLPLLRQGQAGSRGKEKALTILEEVGLASRISHYPHKLSGGERQRVAIARALVTSPWLILADEPTGNLDEDTGAHIFSLFLQMVEKKGCGALIATHNPFLLQKMDQVYHLDHGHVKVRKGGK